MQKEKTFKLVRVIFGKKFLKYEKSGKRTLGHSLDLGQKVANQIKKKRDRASGGIFFLSLTKRCALESSSVWLESEWEK